jgi:hypothetical protein
MIVSQFASSPTASGGSRIEAKLAYEDSDRPSKTLCFECESDPLRLDPNTFLVALYPIAMKHGERRLFVEAETSPLLRTNLEDVMAWWRAWGVAPPSQRLVLEGPVREPQAGTNKFESCSFLSGGIDSLHTLYRNLDNFPVGSSHRITRGILIQGSNQLPQAQIDAVASLVAHAVSNITQETGLRFTKIGTNLRSLEPDLSFWGTALHGPILGAVAHAALGSRGVVRIASTFDAKTMMAPRGSHPLLDAHMSTERVSLLHDSVAHTRLQKVIGLAKHPVALDNAQICGNWTAGYLNCGRCEKCVRTKLAYLIAGHNIPETFKVREVEPNQIHVIRTRYQEQFYLEMAQPLADIGRRDLADAIRKRVSNWPAKLRIRSFAGKAIRTASR